MKPMVYLVGAGPGDFELMTLKGKRCIQQADVLIYDRLASDAFLRLVKPGCQCIYAGKQAGNHAIPQEELNELIAQKALEGGCVVRLKGGDPYVFGRGGEEALYLRSRGIPFEVVPGITSAIAGLCYGGIPITERDCASSFHVITGHAKEGAESAIRWPVLAQEEGTLVFLMGLGQLEEIAGRLMAAGKDPATPAAVISNGTRYNQQVRTAPLREIARAVEQDPVPSPAIIVVGEVVSLREPLNFFERRPLFGRTVVVTRARAQGEELLTALEEQGARAVAMPTISIQPVAHEELDRAIGALGDKTYLIFTSQNTVSLFFDRLWALGLDSRALAGLKLCAVGAATAQCLGQYGLRADLVPPAFSSEGMWQTLKPLLTPRDRVLMPRAKEVVSKLAQRIREVCPVEEVVVYETLPDLEGGRPALELIQRGEADYITFTSPSTVKNTLKLLGDVPEKLRDSRLVSIGPVTSACMRELGLANIIEAKCSTAQGLLEAILEDAAQRIDRDENQGRDDVR